jgi:hypothetical protein
VGCVGVVAFVAVTIGLGVLVNLFGGGGQGQGQQHHPRQAEKAPSSKDQGGKPAVTPIDKPAPEKTTEKTQSPERRIRAAAEAYYANMEYTDWDYTYDHLASETRNTYGREEWANKNAARYDPSIDYKVDSVVMESPTKADVVVVLALGDGSTRFRNTYFVKEDGRWLHQFGAEEYALFAGAGSSASASAGASAGASVPTSDAVNCDQVNGPIPAPPGDPHNLDGDGDGIACEE